MPIAVEACIVQTDTVITPIITLKPNPSAPPSGSPVHSPIKQHTIQGQIIDDCIVMQSSDLDNRLIEIKIKEQSSESILNCQYFLNTNANISIDISMLPIGFYTILIKDGDDEYVGEFEVF